MGTFRWMLTGCSAMLTVFFGVIAILLFGVQQTIFRPDSFKQVLADERIYERAPAIAADALLNSQFGESSPAPERLRYLGAGGLAQLLAPLIPADWLRTTSETALDQSFAFLHSTERNASIPLSLTGLKERLTGEPGYQATLGVLKSWPDCSASQALEWGGALLQGNLSDVPTCAPPDAIVEQAGPLIRAALGTTAFAIPDQVDVGATLTQVFTAPINDENGNPTGNTMLDVWRGVRDTLNRSWIVPVIALVFVALLSFGDPRRMLRWVGGTLVATGILSAIGSLLTGALWNVDRLGQLFGQPAPEQEAIAAAFQDLVGALAGIYARETLLVSGIVVVAGVVMWFVARLLRQADPPINTTHPGVTVQ